MTPGQRFQAWIDSLAQAWQKRLKGWMASWLSFGLDVFFNVLGTAFAPKLKPLIETLEKSGEIPPELQPILDELKSPTGEAAAMLGSAAGYSLIGGAMGKVIDAIFNPLGYFMYRLRPNLMPDLTQILALWLRGHVKEEDMAYYITSQGYRDEMTPMFEDLAQIRLDPASVISAWRRDPAKYEKLFEDLKQQGWTDDRIEALKFFTLYMPSAAEIVHWYAREVYEPDMVDRYGLDSELPIYEGTDFPKIGVDPIQAKHHWMAHWEHASYMQIREMIHRGVLSKAKEMPTPPTTKEGWAARDIEGAEAAYDWYRLVEIPPFWRARLTEMMFEVPTRVDVRRWWDMRTIDEERLRSIYHSQGYHDKDLDDYVLWTKVYVAFPDLIARFKNGWITEAEVRSELTTLGMPSDRVDEMIETKLKAVEPERTEKERDLTKAEITKGVKQEYLTWERGIDLLVDLGYSTSEADFILSINVAVAEGSPETLEEFKDLTQKWRKAVHMAAKPVPEELKKAGIALVRLTKEVAALKEAADAEEKTLLEPETSPKETTAKLDKLRVSLHRAEAELYKAQVDYDSLKAQWHFGG